jgi:hypothetical protein
MHYLLIESCMERLQKGGEAMRRILVIALAIAGLLLLPVAGFSQNVQETAATAPPVAQPLVREGTFAMSLAKALEIGTPQSEADAESLLTSVGIAPKNGWIADYPVTPDVFVSLQEAVVAASESGKLAMGKEEALEKLQSVTDELGLPIVAEGPVQNVGPPTPYNGENPTAISDYYYDYGPPVVTYYAPPPEFGYLYAWVPYPFWFGGFFFGGYYCLHDFNRIIVVNHSARVCTNHVFDRRTGGIVVIDPAGRGRSFTHSSGFGSLHARRDAEGIYNRSLERSGAWPAEPHHVSRGFGAVNPAPSGSAERFQSRIPSGRHYSAQQMRTGRTDGDTGFAMNHERTFGGSPGFARSSGPPAAPERAPSMRFPGSGPGNFNRGESFSGPHGGDFARGGSFGGFNGSYHSGNFNQGNSFSIHNGGFSRGGSFGGFQGRSLSQGGSFGGFHGGGGFGHGGR